MVDLDKIRAILDAKDFDTLTTTSDLRPTLSEIIEAITTPRSALAGRPVDEVGPLLADLRERYSESPITLAYHPDADPGDGSGWAVEVGDRTCRGELVEAMRRHLRPTGVAHG